MKRILLLCCVILMITTNANALIGFNYTGITSEWIDSLGYGPFSYGGYVGGPAGVNSFGGARQVEFFDTTYIDYIRADVDVYDEYTGEFNSILFDYKIYTGSRTGYFMGSEYSDPWVDTSTLAWSSPIVANTFRNDYYVPLGFSLSPGKYWLATETRQSGGGPRTFVSEEYATLVNPEPATGLLFGLGLLGAGLRRKYGQ
jgi:hypothetical protein